jgi:hypothetical protein
VLDPRRAELAWRVAPAAGLAVVFFLARVAIALNPILRETYYDEALTGLMGLEILRGVPQVFYWGQPYLGAIDAYLAAAAFGAFGPSTLALRLGTAWVSVFWVWAAWRIGRRVAGERWGLLAGLQVALPPIFLTFVQLSSHAEGVALALGTVTLGAAVRLVDPPRGRSQAWAWVLLGLAGGLAWWTSQMATMLLGAAAIGLLLARPGVLAGPGPYAALGLFGLASLPFWQWNARHDWATFRHLLQWGDALPGFTVRVQNATGALVRSLRDTYWDGHAVPLPPWASALGWIVVGAVYAPAVGLAAWRLVVWGRRIARRERPWREALDLVALAFWLTVAAQLLTWFGSSGIIRYCLPLQGLLPLLVAAVLARLDRFGRAGRVTAVALAGALVTFNLVTHVAFVRAGTGTPVRPVDAAIAELRALGVTACYADSRIAQVITFESTAHITCADYGGLRNYAALQTVDRIESPETVAIVTHRVLRDPEPEQMARALARIGGTAEETAVGDYVIFHHFGPPDPRIRPIPATGWRARASSDTKAAARAFDRQVWTRWSAPNRPGEWLELDLGRGRPIAQVSLVASPWPADAPSGLRVETSLDGRRWDPAATDQDLLPGLHWWKGHPRVDGSGRVIARFPPREGRYVRLTAIGSERAGASWSVAELFVYETAASPWSPPPAATAALAAATGALDHWMDDPTGPHPLRAPVTSEYRRAHVRWGPALAAADEALGAAPDWEDAHHVYAGALVLEGWGRGPDWLLERARSDGAWLEVLRLDDLIEARPDVEWRAGRMAARAEALDRLGRPGEAAAIRARPAPIPERFVRIRFGRDLELVGVDVPPEARPGETVRLGLHWRLAATPPYDYWAFLHVVGLPGGGNHDAVVGGPYGPSHWPAGERVRQTVAFTIPPDTRPGTYPLRVGVWLPSTGRRLHILSADVPQAHGAASLEPLVVR